MAVQPLCHMKRAGNESFSVEFERVDGNLFDHLVAYPETSSEHTSIWKQADLNQLTQQLRSVVRPHKASQDHRGVAWLGHATNRR